MTRPEYVQQVKETLHNAMPGAEVILFGSEARGEAREDSDIDVLVLLDKEELTFDDRHLVINVLYDLQAHLNFSIDINPVIRTRKEWYHPPFKTPFYINVMNDGIKLL
jgi:predicted nucleotidyltransferase